jgi:hypothetical protein
MQTTKQQRLKILSIIQLALIAIIILTIWESFLSTEGAISSWTSLISFLLANLVLLVCAGNPLYNFQLLKAYHASGETPVRYKKAGGIVLLCCHSLLIIWAFVLSIILIEEWLASTIREKFPSFEWSVISFLVFLSLTGAWTIVLQIKHLRKLRNKQQSASEQLLASIGHTTEDMPQNN